jgi:oligopeptidase A
MGHALHHLLSVVIEPSVSGVNAVAWDVVEYPSQFLENFCFDFETIKKFAKHYETGEPMSKAMIDKLIKAKNYQTALATQRQVEFAMFDMKLHTALYQGEQVQELLDSVREKISVFDTPPYNKFQNSFDHIFGGGYSAGYYSYKWAQVLSADSFMRYLYASNDKEKKAYMKRYLQTVLALGGSVHMNKIYIKLNGERANINSLLKLEGII